MGSILEELHERHKARQARIKQAAIVEIVPVKPPPAVVLVVEPEPPKPQPIIAINQQIGKSCFELVTNEICTYYNIRKTDLLSKRRMGGLALKRQILTYLLYNLTTYTNGQIGDRLNLDPTTVGYSIKKIIREMDKHRADIDELEARISLLLAQRK